MGFSTILREKSEHIATLTLNRPDARNAIDLVMREEIVAALDEMEADESTRVVIVTGAGRVKRSSIVKLRPDPISSSAQATAKAAP